MASRADQKAQLRAERVAREKAEAEAAARRQRIGMAAGIVIVAALVVVVVIAIASHHNRLVSTQQTGTIAQQTDTRVASLLAGIPQSGNVLGNPSAPVSVIEYGDLECSVCDAFALSSSVDTSDGTPGSGVEDEIIQKLVKTGKAKLVYRSLETATAKGATPDEWIPQQVAVYAAGMQNKGFNYMELFYNEQGEEGSDYVNAAYLDGLAKQIPGLNFAQWKRDLSSSTLENQVNQENREGTKIDDGEASTPTVVVAGKKGQQLVSNGIPSYAQVVTAIKAVQ